MGKRGYLHPALFELQRAVGEIRLFESHPLRQIPDDYRVHPRRGLGHHDTLEMP